MEHKKYLFISGTSESGKSYASKYLESIIPRSIHIKMRDVLWRLYKEKNNKLEYYKWMKYEEKNNPFDFWSSFIEIANAMSEDKKVVIMDTLHGKDSIFQLYEILGEQLNLLYIDAQFELRVCREYNKIIKSNKYIDYNELLHIVKRKDEEKVKMGLLELKYLVYDINKNLRVDYKMENTSFTYVIENDGTLDEFHERLNTFASDYIDNSKVFIIKKW